DQMLGGVLRQRERTMVRKRQKRRKKRPAAGFEMIDRKVVERVVALSPPAFGRVFRKICLAVNLIVAMGSIKRGLIVEVIVGSVEKRRVVAARLENIAKTLEMRGRRSDQNGKVAGDVHGAKRPLLTDMGPVAHTEHACEPDAVTGQRVKV